MAQLFVPSDGIGFLPQLFLMLVYAYILFTASKLISDGSELLLSIYGPGIVGGLVIPILGAVPDAAIILVSGLGGGSREEIQDELAVGVGTLAGSSIMLLTLPWAAGTFLGRRDLDPDTGMATTAKGAAKLTHWSWTTNVVTTDANVPTFAKIMVLTSVSYLIIQIPAFFDQNDDDASKEEAPFALVGLIVTALAFVAYCWYQLRDAKQQDLKRELHRQAERRRWQKSLSRKFQTNESFAKVFRSFDRDGNGYLDMSEMSDALATLGFKADRKELSQIIKTMDTNADGRVSEGEFSSVISNWINEHTKKALGGGGSDGHHAHHDLEAGQNDKKEQEANNDGDDNDGDDNDADGDMPMKQPFLGGKHDVEAGHHGGEHGEDDDEEEEEEEEEEYLELTDKQLIQRSLALLGLGTALVTIFSDPMVDVINNFGKTIHVGAFYVSFVITPLASNASEVLSALVFARKKTSKGISLTYSSLYGAASMNNTLGLSIFMGLVYFRKLQWTFSAEVLSILLVTLLVGLNGMRRTVNMRQAVLVALLFPLSLGFVVLLEKGAGLN